MNIDPNKLVMGVPWYGYDYSCLNFSKVRNYFSIFSVQLFDMEESVKCNAVN